MESHSGPKPRVEALRLATEAHDEAPVDPMASILEHSIKSIPPEHQAHPVAPTTPVAASAANVSATAVSPAVPLLPLPQQHQDEDRSIHHPYERGSMTHAAHLFPGVKGHEKEEYEETVGYASPEDVSPDVKRAVEGHEKYGWGKEEAKKKASSPSQQAQDEEGQEKGEGEQQQKQGVRAKVVQAAQATVERAGGVMGTLKTKTTGVPADKPLVEAMKEKMGISVETPWTEAAKEVTGAATSSIRRATAESISKAKSTVTQVSCCTFVRACEPACLYNF